MGYETDSSPKVFLSFYDYDGYLIGESDLLQCSRTEISKTVGEKSFTFSNYTVNLTPSLISNGICNNETTTLGLSVSSHHYSYTDPDNNSITEEGNTGPYTSVIFTGTLDEIRGFLAGE